MRKVLKPAIAILLLALAIAYLFREPLREFAYAWLTRDMFVTADMDDFDPGPVIGSHFPGLRATYRGRDITLIEEFAGANGTVFIAGRSYDWCPYCVRQLIQLQENSAGFATAGIGMVAMSYDPPTLHQSFIDKHGITIPVLSDKDALSFKTLGILNAAYEPGDPRYGIAHPGIIVIDTDGRVVGKLFLEAYNTRVDSRAVLAFAKTALELD
jgi:peroxiredoxin